MGVENYRSLFQSTKPLIIYLTAGFPTLELSKKIALEIMKRGLADSLEIGIPFSDPVADGKIIQYTSYVALQNGTKPQHALDIVKFLRDNSITAPIAIMSYYNPIYVKGEKFFQEMSKAGVDGLIIPDISLEELESIKDLFDETNIARITFVAPNTPKERKKKAGKLANAFIYLVSITGTTGIRESLPTSLPVWVKETKDITKKPVCVGFGISSHSHIKEVLSIADGAIVGSAFLKVILENLSLPEDLLIEKIISFLLSLKYGQEKEIHTDSR